MSTGEASISASLEGFVVDELQERPGSSLVGDCAITGSCTARRHQLGWPTSAKVSCLE